MENTNYIVYLDIIFVINFCMDYVLLWGTAKFSQVKTTRLRIITASFIGAFYSLALLLPTLHFLLSISIKFLFSVIMVIVCFSPLNLKRFFQVLAYFYLVAFTMGGAMFGAVYFLNKGTDLYQTVSGIFVFMKNIRYTWLFAAVVAVFLLVRYGVGFVKKNFFHSFFSVPIVIRFGKEKISARALIDTGNQLKDPLTGNPVMILEFELLKKILPEKVYKALEEKEGLDLNGIINSLEDSYWASRIRMIPFSSIGKYKGMLIGVRPDEVIIVTNDGVVKVKDMIIGIYHKKLSPEGSYRALLHPDILSSTIGL